MVEYSWRSTKQPWLSFQGAFSKQCSLSPTDPSLVFLPTVTSEEVFIFITGYTEAVIPCRVTNPQMQVTLYEKKVENPIPATYDPQQGFKGFFEDKTYFCRTYVDDQEVDSDTFYVYRIQGELTLSWHTCAPAVAVSSSQWQEPLQSSPPVSSVMINLVAGFSPVSVREWVFPTSQLHPSGKTVSSGPVHPG